MKLIWTDPSLEDLRAIRNYIARDSDCYAADLVEQLVLSVERLPRFPRMGRVVPEAQDESIGDWCARITALFTAWRRNESKSLPSFTAGET